MSLHYVPILKVKQGELNGLGALDAALTGHMIPLFEIQQEMFLSTRTRTTPEQILAHAVRSFTTAWPHQAPLFLDASPLPPELLPWLPAIGNAIANSGGMPIPVTWTEQTREHQEAVHQLLPLTGGELCFRVRARSGIIGTINDNLAALLALHGVRPETVHLVFDLGSVPPLMFGAAQTVAGLVNGIAHLQAWKTFTIAGTGYPETLNVPPQDSALLPRHAWLLWNQMLREGNLQRIPSFGDYAISSAVPFEFEPYMDVSAKIRYTTDQDWLVIKGRSSKRNGFEQYRELSRQLIERREYCGPNYSQGDKYIDDCAHHHTRGPGNSTTWVQVGVNHHLTFVLRQLASLLAP